VPTIAGFAAIGVPGDSAVRGQNHDLASRSNVLRRIAEKAPFRQPVSPPLHPGPEPVLMHDPLARSWSLPCHQIPSI
jgi:hypothetical protein